MAKLSAINKNNKRIKLANKFYKKRDTTNIKRKIWLQKRIYGSKDLQSCIKYGFRIRW